MNSGFWIISIIATWTVKLSTLQHAPVMEKSHRALLPNAVMAHTALAYTVGEHVPDMAE
jgi:hypothetical protein